MLIEEVNVNECSQIKLTKWAWGWTRFYIGMIAICFGSSYYHLNPNHARLMWHCLPVRNFSCPYLSYFSIEHKLLLTCYGFVLNFLIIRFCFNFDSSFFFHVEHRWQLPLLPLWQYLQLKGFMHRREKYPWYLYYRWW